MEQKKDFSDTRETIERASEASGARQMLDELAKKMRTGSIHTKLYHGSNNPNLNIFLSEESDQMFLGYGVYFATTPEHARQYGKYIYEIELSIPDSEIASLGFGEHWYTYNQFLKEYSYIDNKERFRQYIGLAKEFSDDTGAMAASKGDQVVVYDTSIIKILRKNV